MKKKDGIKRGTVTQKMMAFRLDGDLVDKLEQVANKGRLINQLLHDHFAQEIREDDDPEWGKIEDTQI